MNPPLFLVRLAPLLAAALLAACANLAPEYQRPAAPVAAAWPAGAAGQAGDTGERSAAERAWPAFFVDPRLRGAIAAALANNRDLRVAALQIERSRALHQIQRAERWPSVEAAASMDAQRTPASLAGGGRATTTHQYEAGVGFARYEIDFFGRVRNLNEQALQAFLATAEARRSVHISLVAAVANTYLTLAADRERLVLAQRTFRQPGRVVHPDPQPLRARRRVAARPAACADHGRRSTRRCRAFHPPGDAGSKRTRVAGRRAAARRVAAAGRWPPSRRWTSCRPACRRPAAAPARHPPGRAPPAGGACGDRPGPRGLLPQRQPDRLRRRCQRRVVRAVPRRRRRLELAAPHQPADLRRRRNRATLQAAEAGREIALADYERTIQTAFREVADALAARGTLGRELTAQQSLVDAAADSQRLSEIRFREGAESYLAVLDAQRSRYAAEQDLIGLRLQRLANQVTLYKVLGGGWSGPEVDAPVDVTARR